MEGMKKHLVLTGICIVTLLVIFMGTDASKVPSPVLMLPFVLLFALLSSFAAVLLRLQGIAVTRSWRIALIFAAVPIILLVLQSIGQLTIKDVLTIAVLLAISYFYVSRSTASS
jgi:hypothetical protein